MFTMKIKALLSLGMAAIITAGAAAPCSLAVRNQLAAQAADDTNDDWLHCEGSRIFDKDGKEVWLTGANWFGLNCSENAPHGLYAAEADPFLEAVADRGINVIRFPVSSELLISWMNGEPLAVSSVQCWGDENQGFNIEFLEADGKTTKNSLEIFEILLTKLKKYGLKCFIDVHSPHSDNSGHDWALWYGKAGVTTKSWIDSLVWTAKHFKNDDTVLGYDLENEPHGKGQDGKNAAKWDGSTDENNWAYAATQCAEAILAVHPNALIFVEGVEQSLSGAQEGDYWGIADRRDNSPYIGAWWGGNLRGAKDYPIKPKQGTSQIVYSPHDYGPVVYQQEWFKKNFTEETLLDDYWRDSWAYINEQEIGPLLIGEWGGKLPKGADFEKLATGDASGMDDFDKNARWMVLLRNYMIKHHINHTFWCLNPNSGDTEGLLGNDYKSWDEEKYKLFEKALWQTQTSGKYIGLDHKTPLGKNGISLSEYYSSYAASEGSNLDGGTKGQGTHGSEVDIKTTPNDETQPPKEITTTEPDVTEKQTEKPDDTTKPSGGTEEPQTGSFRYGDVDCNGDINVADAVMLARYIAEDKEVKVSAQGISNAKMNNGKTVTSEDTTKLLMYLANLIPEEDLAPKVK